MITTFGLGHMRPASGTWGSLPPVVWAGALLLVAWFTTADVTVRWVYFLSLWGVLVAFSWAVVVGGDRAEAIFGVDPKEVVADETAGQCIPLLVVPLLAPPGLWHAALAVGLAFLLFRIFDIAKVWPASALQRLPGAWGILLDDLVAGVYAGAALWLVALVW
jgi:phosphatidylglycerophosphatase A